MSFTTADVVKLRKSTGAGMMDCKNALTESDGDFDRAVEIIRERGKLVASKRADRQATEGAVLAKVSEDKKFGAIVVLNCETDFVAKNEKFIAFTTQILDAALANKPATLDELKNIVLDGRSIGDQVTEQVGIIGEKLDLSYYGKVEAETVVPYIHPGNKLASIVGFTKADVENQLGKDIAMQIAAMSPVAVNRESIPQHIIDKEHEIAMEKFRLEGKPEAMLDKIAMGAVQKWFSEAALMEQSFIKDNKLSVKQYVAQNDKTLNVTGFDRYALDA
jgi:elongation factor Ts